MRYDEINEQDNDPNRTKLPSQIPALSRQGKVKQAFDFMILTPGKTRKGVARSGDALQGFIEYNMKLFRSDDKRWALYLEWVSLEGEGNRVVFPHEVVAGILQRANSIIAQCRSERAKRASLTRKAKGFIPFQKKGSKEQG